MILRWIFRKWDVGIDKVQVRDGGGGGLFFTW
jgi:hypothetical protein